MKKMLCAALIASAAMTAQASAATAPKGKTSKASLAAFTFKDAKAGETMEPGIVGKCKPHTEDTPSS